MLKNKYKNIVTKGSKSNLEILAKKLLSESGLEFCYECNTYTIVEPIEYPSYQKVGKAYKLRKAERPTTYTPDFVGVNWIVETKGMQTEKFKLQWKLFKHYLAKNGLDYSLYMPTNKNQILESIKLIKDGLPEQL